MPEGGHRLRLRPWIIEQINSGKYKGLDWIDENKTEFKVPWKHAAKNDYDQEEDSKIFRAWSLHTGKYKVGIDKVEPAVWKTRLRTALNKLPDVYEVRDKKLRSAEGIPFRVYKLLPQREHPWSRREDEEEYLPRRSSSRKSSFGRKRRKYSYASTPRDDAFTALETEKKKFKKENDFRRIHFKKREKFRSFNIGRSSPPNLPETSNGDVEMKPSVSQSETPVSDAASPERKVFPDTLPVTDGNGLLVTATVAANGIPVAMTVVPTCHTTTSTNSVVSSGASSSSSRTPVCQPSPSTPVTSAVNGHSRCDVGKVSFADALQNGLGGQKPICSVANDPRPGSERPIKLTLNNGPVSAATVELNNFRPLNGVSRNAQPPAANILPNVQVKSEVGSAPPPAPNPTLFPLPTTLIPNGNGLIFTYPGMPSVSQPSHLMPAASQHLQLTAPQQIFASNFSVANGLPCTLPQLITTTTALPLTTPPIQLAPSVPRKEKIEPVSCVPKIESVVSLGMIAAKLLESQRMEAIDAKIEAEEKEKEAADNYSELQPIPLNYVVKSHQKMASRMADPPPDNLLVEVNYKSTRALKCQVTNPSGCHLYYVNPMIKEEAIEIEYGPVDVEQLCFPDFNEFCMSEKQTELTTTLLQHMEKGLLLKCKDGDVYLTRFGRTVVFWSSTQNDSPEPEKTKRGEEVKIFDYQKFQSNMRSYIYGLGPCPEPPKIFLGIGQQWSSNYPLKNNLVSIIVTPLRAMEEYVTVR